MSVPKHIGTGQFQAAAGPYACSSIYAVHLLEFIYKKKKKEV